MDYYIYHLGLHFINKPFIRQIMEDEQRTEVIAVTND